MMMPGPDPKLFEADAQLLRDCLKDRYLLQEVVLSLMHFHIRLKYHQNLLQYDDHKFHHSFYWFQL